MVKALLLSLRRPEIDFKPSVGAGQETTALLDGAGVEGRVSHGPVSADPFAGVTAAVTVGLWDGKPCGGEEGVQKGNIPQIVSNHCHQAFLTLWDSRVPDYMVSIIHFPTCSDLKDNGVPVLSSQVNIAPIRIGSLGVLGILGAGWEAGGA